MKQLLIAIILFIPFVGMAQNETPVDRLFNKYANKDGFSTVNISGKLLSFASEASNSESKEGKMLKNLKGIRILSVEDKNLNKTINFYKELEADGFFKNNNYDVLMEVTEKDEVVRFYGRSGEKGVLSELILVVGGNDNTLISISGSIDPKDIGKISGSLNLDIPKSSNEAK